jgi:exodeoxyribonuclease-3
MTKVEMLSWNVNGMRSVVRKGFLEWLKHQSPDFLCLQETKSRPEQLKSELIEPEGFNTYWNFPERKGYGGVALFSRQVPLRVDYNFPASGLDLEGRIIIARYPDFVLLNVYFPNGKQGDIRLRYKLDFYEAFLGFIDSLKARGSRLIICGDFNTAHSEIDLARPRANAKVSGFLPIERAWMDKLVSHGYIDTLRYFHKESGLYSWWDLKTGARDRNVGWRIDYFFITEDLIPALSGAFIMPHVTGSDHCPVGIILDIDKKRP